MSRVLVVGSVNMDLVVSGERLPRPGETVPGRAFRTHPGGKGLNQAVAAAKLGAVTELVGCVGSDAFGDELCAFLSSQGVDITGVRRSRGAATGVALITVDALGQNSIVVVPGANGELGAHALPLAPEAGDLVLCQLEVPIATVERAFELARAAGALGFFNPAPALRGAARAFELADIVLANELELAFLLGADTVASDHEEALRAAEQLARDERVVVVTLGSRGVVAAGRGLRIALAAHDVEAIDTTGAGDTFAGALAAALASGEQLEPALRQANAAAACSVRRRGAAEASPTRAELASFLRDRR